LRDFHYLSSVNKIKIKYELIILDHCWWKGIKNIMIYWLEKTVLWLMRLMIICSNVDKGIGYWSLETVGSRFGKNLLRNSSVLSLKDKKSDRLWVKDT
jgi:hypothetical protein